MLEDQMLLKKVTVESLEIMISWKKWHDVKRFYVVSKGSKGSLHKNTWENESYYRFLDLNCRFVVLVSWPKGWNQSLPPKKIPSFLDVTMGWSIFGHHWIILNYPEVILWRWDFCPTPTSSSKTWGKTTDYTWTYNIHTWIMDLSVHHYHWT